MQTTLTSKGQVTIPKHIRDALHLEPGCPIEFRINRDGEVVLKRPDERRGEDDRFERMRGKADVKWRTDDLMGLLRGDD
ncbi:MAG: antitoxin PrlF [Rhodocyclaceae bacterium]|nr:antitoxin PrlF [Rhodocyclaceae bacterium]